MTMKILWEEREGSHTRYGFYLDDVLVKFEYSGPFDLNTDEWIYSCGTFRTPDFAESVTKLANKSCAQVSIKGLEGETLTLKTLPLTGGIRIDFDGGPSNNILNVELRVRPDDLFVKLPG